MQATQPSYINGRLNSARLYSRKVGCALILFFVFSTQLRAGERVEGFSTIRSYSELHYALNITAFVLTLFLSQKTVIFPDSGRKKKQYLFLALHTTIHNYRKNIFQKTYTSAFW